MKIVNIDKQLEAYKAGKVRQRIYKVGVELEGGWKKQPPGGAIVHDGSVRFALVRGQDANVRMGIDGRAVLVDNLDNPVKPKDPDMPAYVGELPSEPLTLKELKPWLEANYPTHINATCGMHCHMSFNSALTYQRLMVPDLTPTIVEYIARWAKVNLPNNHHIWPRLLGESEYCQHKFYADEQARRAQKDHQHHAPGCRYTVMNYCYTRYQTAECRLLPTMPTVDLAFNALSELFGIVNAFLAATAAREPRHSTLIPYEQDVIPEEIIECV